MNWYLEKFAAIEYMYHGAGIQNLSSILSEGLRANAPLNYEEEIDYNSVRSYGGVYLTDNFMTARHSGRKSSEKQDQQSKQFVLVIAQIETKTPHIVLDEDLLSSPSWIIDKRFRGRGA